MTRVPVADYALNAHTVDGYHASASAAAGKLLTLDDSGVFPSGVCGSSANADTVDGYHASASVTANYLLTLNDDGEWPSGVCGSSASAGNADTVDNIHASASATANYLLALDASGKFPSGVVSGSTLKTFVWIVPEPIAETVGQVYISESGSIVRFSANIMSGSATCTVNVQSCSALGSTGSNILSSAMVAGSAGGYATSGLGLSSLVAGHHLALVISASTGNVDYLTVGVTESVAT